MKRKNTRTYKINTSTDVDYMKVIKIGIGVLLVLALVYFVTALATGEIKFGKEATEEEETIIQYDEIIAGETFNRPEEEYYVLYMNFTDTFASYYLSLIDTYETSDDSLNFYTVDIEKVINTDYVTNELKVENPTILKISNSKITETITGRDNILNFFE